MGRLSTDRGRIAESLRLGATAMASALYGEPARLMWRPVPYLAPDSATEVVPRCRVRRSRRRQTPPSGSGLDVCGYCQGDYVVPVWFEDLGEDGWHLLLRCGECETYREVIVGDDTANAYDRELDRGGPYPRRALAKLDGARMAAQVGAFIVALRSDLIDADDFVTRPIVGVSN